MAVERGEGLEFPDWLRALPARVAEPVPAPPPGVALSPAYASRVPSAGSTFPEAVRPASAQSRVSDAIRAAAHASAVSQATQQAFVDPGRVARETARIEQKLRAEAENLKRAGMSAANIEALVKRKTVALRKKTERAVKALPAPVRHEIARQAEQAVAPIKREASKLVAPALVAVRQEATKIGRQLGVDQATQAFRDFGKKMGIPNIPVALPADLTPAAIRDAAYNTGRKMVQDRLAQATGVSLPLPNAVSVKAIKKWADDLVPDDARQAIEMGVDIGLSATTSAVSSILAGAIGGSVVPGLGTVIGIGVALGVAALKSVVKEALTEKHAAQQLCKADDKLYQQYVKQASGRAAGVQLPKLSPLQYVPWVAQKSFEASKVVAEEQSRTKCGRTPYMTTLRQIGKNVFEPAKATVPVLGLQQLDQLIPLYDKAPKQEYFWDKGRIQPGGHIVGGTGKVLFGPSAAGYDVSTLLKLMQTRHAQLQALVAQASRVESLPPNAIAPLRFNLVTEIRNATMMYQLDPNKLTEAWLKMLMGFLARLVRTEAAAVGAMKSRYEQDLKREAELKKQGKTGVVTGII